MMQAIGRVYVRYVNARYQRTGTSWEGRYRSSLVDSARYLLACFRYIELNPVRAGMVKHPIQYRWSSYGHNARGKPDSVITHHAVYHALASSETDRHAAYRALFETGLERKTLDFIRGATNRGTLLGDGPFREQIEASLGTRVTRLPHGGDRRSKACKGSESLIPSYPDQRL